MVMYAAVCEYFSEEEKETLTLCIWALAASSWQQKFQA